MDNYIEKTNERPQFLKVICIISFVACGLMILTGLWGIYTSLNPMEMQEMQKEMILEKVQQDSPENYDAAIQFYDTQTTQGALGLLLQFISLFAVIMMWKMKKPGFYLYVFSELFQNFIGLIICGKGTLAVMAASMPPQMQEMGPMLALGVMIVLDIVFIILYAVNLKHMK